MSENPRAASCTGQTGKCEHEYIRHGTRALIASFVVATGQGVWALGQTRTSTDFATHLANVVTQLPAMHRYAWVVDNLNTHWSLDVCRVVAQWCQVPFVAKDLSQGVQRRAFLRDPSHTHVFHVTPKHGSWLNQVELWFSVLAAGFLSEATSVQPNILQPVSLTISRSTTPIRLIRIGGRIRGSPW